MSIGLAALLDGDGDMLGAESNLSAGGVSVVASAAETGDAFGTDHDRFFDVLPSVWGMEARSLS